jgi:hypothetical protein
MLYRAEAYRPTLNLLAEESFMFKPLLVLAGLLVAQAAHADLLFDFHATVGPDSFSWEYLASTFPTSSIFITNSLLTRSKSAPGGFSSVSIQNPSLAEFHISTFFVPIFLMASPDLVHDSMVR